jgi:hypothetical protein
MKNPFMTAFRFLRSFFQGVDQAQREKMAALTNYEARELENMFVLLLIGSFAGMPSPPSFLAVELMPFLEREIRVLNRRAESASDALAEIMGTIDADA